MTPVIMRRPVPSGSYQHLCSWDDVSRMKTGIISGETVILKSLSRNCKNIWEKNQRRSSVQFGWSEEGVKKIIIKLEM